MGAYLSQPITDKESSDGEDGRFKYGTTAMQGWRTNMEVRERGGFGRRLCRSRPASRRRPRVANGEISDHFPRRHPSGAGKVSRGRRKISRPLPLSPALTEPTTGLRPQDAHATVLGLDEDTAFFGVYDGHGGKEVRPPPAPGSIASDVAERRSFFPRAKCFFLFSWLSRVPSRARIANRVADRSLLSRTRSTALAAADDDDDVSVTLVTPRSDRNKQ
jgi:hypothetical protein